MIIYIIIGLIGGFMSGFMGIGGGLVMVPLMVFLAKFTQHLAQGASLAVLSLPVVIFGAYQYYTHGNVDIKSCSNNRCNVLCWNFFGIQVRTHF